MTQVTIKPLISAHSKDDVPIQPHRLFTYTNPQTHVPAKATGAAITAAALCDNIYGRKPEDKHIFYNSENVVHFLLRLFTLARIYRAPYRFDGD